MRKFAVLLLILLSVSGMKAESKDVSGKNFMLPKNIKINDKYLAPLEPATISKPYAVPKAKTETTTVKLAKPASIPTSPSKTEAAAVKSKPITPPVKASSSNALKPVVIIGTEPATTKTYKPANLKINNETTTLKTIKSESTTLKEIKVLLPPASTTANSSQKIIVKEAVTEKNTVGQNNLFSVQNLIKTYNNSYTNTFKAAIMAISTSGASPVSFNTSKGQIIAKLDSDKEILILIVPYSEKSTSIRITPADGNYNIPMSGIKKLFKAIDENLIETQATKDIQIKKQ